MESRSLILTLTKVVVWNLEGLPACESKRLRDTRHGTAIYACCFSPRDPELLATGGRGSEVALWQWRSARLLRHFSTGLDQVLCVAFSPDGGYLATSGEGHAVQLWIPTQQSDHEPHGAFLGHTKAAFGCAIGAASRGRYLLVSCSHDRTARVWKFRAEAPATQLPSLQAMETSAPIVGGNSQPKPIRGQFGREEDAEQEAFEAYRRRLRHEKAARTES